MPSDKRLSHDHDLEMEQLQRKRFTTFNGGRALEALVHEYCVKKFHEDAPCHSIEIYRVSSWASLDVIHHSPTIRCHRDGQFSWREFVSKY